MISYASVDRLEGKFAVCEVELISICESKPEDFRTKPTEMMDIYIQDIIKEVGDVNEGDILEVEHDGEKVTKVYCKNADEKKRRMEL